MKIKVGFVTNSSSSCYVIGVNPDEIDSLKEYITKLNKNPEASNEVVRIYNEFRTMKQLIEHTTGHPYDWASKPRGITFQNLSEKEFDTYKGIIKDGLIAFEVAVDHNVCEIFEDVWKYNIMGQCW